jgi:hypothetical protein
MTSALGGRAGATWKCIYLLSASCPRQCCEREDEGWGHTGTLWFLVVDHLLRPEMDSWQTSDRRSIDSDICRLSEVNAKQVK